MSADSLILAPYGADPLPLLARRLLERHANELPDLGRHIVLLPQPASAARFRAALLGAARACGYAALLPPWIGTLAVWLNTQAASIPTLTPAARELLLFQALAPFPGLMERFGPWSMIDGVLPLFDELTSHAVSLPTDRNGIRQILVNGYGAAKTPALLEQEADWIHTLWRTWSEHLATHGWHDAPLAHRATLTRLLATLPTTTHFYMAVDVALPTTQRQWLRELLQRGQLTLLVQGQYQATPDYHPDRPIASLVTELGLTAPAPTTVDTYGEFLNQVFHTDVTVLGTRARDFARRHPQTPTRDRLALHVAVDLEHEARAVELQVRRWLIAGQRDIAVVTPDRKLARRVRALLERANVALADHAGWALSTTSAATALARWLECCEQQFAHAPLLDFLKSPFVTLGMDRDSYARAVRQFEHAIVRRYGIRRGLGRYRAAWRRYAAQSDDNGVDTLLDRLAHALEPLQRFINPTSVHAPAVYFDALAASIKRLGLMPPLEADAAGRELLAAVELMRTAPTVHSARLTYPAFRRWLEREIERRRFRPDTSDASVHLLSAPESRHGQFDAIVIAGGTSDQLPGNVAPSPFFNETVRRNIGLPSLAVRLSHGLHDFRRLLQAAPTVLLSYRQHDGRELKLPSPWIERLVAFHQAAYGALDDGGLADLLRVPATHLTHRDEPSPAPVTMPAPTPARAYLPTHWSASAHQRLLDCPYQFYVADVLRLLELDTVPEEIERSHYGERVHRILHAFHHGLPGLPGPWTGPLTDATRKPAEKLLGDITRTVFASEIEDRFTVRAWLYHWQAMIPAYLDWLQTHWAAGYQAVASELKMERTIYIENYPLTLKGRIDRVDEGPHGKLILDYKTGQFPDADAIATGEQAQLGFYTLLVDTVVDAAMYVGLREPPVKIGRTPTGNELSILRNALLQRISSMANRLGNGAALPAWGDQETCDRCHYEGLCRKGLWTSDPPIGRQLSDSGQ